MSKTQHLKIQVQKAGGFVKARYEGRTTCCFGLTPEEAINKLKLFHGVKP